MPSFQYDFEELPLYRQLGFGGARVDGTALISFDDEDENLGWHVDSITLDGFKVATLDRQPMPLDIKSSLALMIIDALEDTCRPAIDVAIASAMEDDGHVFADPNDEHRLGVFETIAVRRAA